MPQTKIGSGFVATGAVGPTSLSTGAPYWDTSGNVGIGTSSPTFTTAGGLHINKSSDVTVDLHLTNATTGSSATDGFDLLLSGSDALLVQRENANMAFYTNATERMRIDSSGNVGIGTTDTSAGKLTVQQASSTTGGPSLTLWNNNASAGNTCGYLKFYSNTSIRAQIHSVIDSGAPYYGNLIFSNGEGSSFYERMRIDFSGNLLVGTTSQITSGKLSINYSASTHRGIVIKTDSTNVTAQIRFENPNGGVGEIQTSGSATSYVTSSDYRLKENVQPMTTGLAKISALKPVIYDWISDKSEGEGFIAHELQSVIPLAVTGEKDAVDDDGKIIPQGVDYSKIVVHLVAAIQELTAKVTALEAKVGP